MVTLCLCRKNYYIFSVVVVHEDGNHFIYSMSKKQLRKIKLGAIDGIREYARMKKIIFHSEVVQDVQRILELKLSKEIGKEIDKEIMKEVFKLGSQNSK